MPRYRFAWSNLPAQLRKKLSSGLGLEGEPVDALRRQYGARPKVVFVQDAWPLLLEAWLPSDGASRQFLAQELQALGLGKTDIAVRTKQGQLDYLRSCRNSARLRELALAAFLAAGEADHVALPPTAPSERRPGQPLAAHGSRPDEAAGPQIVECPPPLPEAERPVGTFDEWVTSVLRDAYGWPEVHRDADGDIPVPHGSVVLFIRPHDGDSPFLEVFAPLLRGFRPHPDVFQAVNAINNQVRLAKALVTDDGSTIVLTAHVLAETLSASELLFTIDLVSHAADHFDTLLQRRFGGHTMLEDDSDAIAV